MEDSFNRCHDVQVTKSLVNRVSQVMKVTWKREEDQRQGRHRVAF